MDPRVEKLIVEFESNGWTQSKSFDISADWWFEDILKLISIWRPIDKPVYLTLLTDPEVLNKKIVWSIGISSEIPNSRHFNFIAQISLKEIKKTNLKTLVERLNEILRN